jgi:hypothetical protein
MLAKLSLLQGGGQQRKAVTNYVAGVYCNVTIKVFNKIHDKTFKIWK